jgi:hypothetical protein
MIKQNYYRCEEPSSGNKKFIEKHNYTKDLHAIHFTATPLDLGVSA